MRKVILTENNEYWNLSAIFVQLNKNFLFGNRKMKKKDTGWLYTKSYRYTKWTLKKNQIKFKNVYIRAHVNNTEWDK